MHTEFVFFLKTKLKLFLNFRGDDPMLVIWDAKTATPRKTIFE